MWQMTEGTNRVEKNIVKYKINWEFDKDKNVRQVVNSQAIIGPLDEETKGIDYVDTQFEFTKDE